VNAKREFIHTRPLSTQIIDLDLWLRDPSAEPRFGVWLVFDVSITPGWTSTHSAEAVLFLLSLEIY
jgi:hypothetical protein